MGGYLVTPDKTGYPDWVVFFFLKKKKKKDFLGLLLSQVPLLMSIFSANGQLRATNPNLPKQFIKQFNA
jgi:hypothetical protein